TRPPATMGVECVSVPRLAIHLIFLPDLGSNDSSKPFSSEVMLRDHARPHCGWSEPQARKPRAPKPKPRKIVKLQLANRPRKRWQRRTKPDKTFKAQNKLLFISELGSCSFVLIASFPVYQRETSACRSTRNW